MIQPKPTSILSIDYGHKRIGLAGCDPLGVTISRLPAIHRASFHEDLKQFKDVCHRRKVEGLLIGLPLNEKGALTKQAKYCQRYGKRLAISLELPMALINEHSSSWAAKELYKMHNDRTGELDSAVAGLLLEQWLREGPEIKPVQMPTYEISQVN